MFSRLYILNVFLTYDGFIRMVVLVVKNLPANAEDLRDTGSVPGLGRSPGGGHGNLLQYSCLETAKDREAWQATVHGVTKNRTRLKQLSTHTHILLKPTLTHHLYEPLLRYYFICRFSSFHKWCWQIYTSYKHFDLTTLILNGKAKGTSGIFLSHWNQRTKHFSSHSSLSWEGECSAWACLPWSLTWTSSCTTWRKETTPIHKVCSAFSVL